MKESLELNMSDAVATTQKRAELREFELNELIEKIQEKHSGFLNALLSTTDSCSNHVYANTY